jgi:hypothetical protein
MPEHVEGCRSDAACVYVSMCDACYAEWLAEHQEAEVDGPRVRLARIVFLAVLVMAAVLLISAGVSDGA